MKLRASTRGEPPASSSSAFFPREQLHRSFNCARNRVTYALAEQISNRQITAIQRYNDNEITRRAEQRMILQMKNVIPME